MLKLFLFVLILITLVALSIFIDGVLELHKQEKEDKKNIIRDGMEGYLDKTFGFGNVTIFKSILCADGNTRYLVYLPKYEWFKSPKYEWYEVYAYQNGYKHEAVNG
ncbi:hypothetical protein P9D43_03190 [Neobacillus niacini]|uniref:hypothetical protein n=1 Tax=Neobacillus niacini TaxID=86668 RepID=UPI00052F908E|nr:hypothetical protein [Neobacillus niacini]KGM45002.1 hypothetical protein NP83_08555 [Neobacillus niacini]MEC1521041.1 hypothetical protein [Neobacillus niacini]